MHKAPSVSYPVGPFIWYARSLWLFWCLLCLAAAAVALQRPVLVSRDVAGVVVTAVVAAWVVRWHARHQPRGCLSWQNEPPDGAEWVWHPAGAHARLVQVLVVWRGLGCVWVRLRSSEGVAWVWAQAEDAPNDWLAFRRALISSDASQ